MNFLPGKILTQKHTQTYSIDTTTLQYFLIPFFCDVYFIYTCKCDRQVAKVISKGITISETDSYLNIQKKKHGVLIISNCCARSHTFERLFFGNKCVNCLAMFNIGPCIWDDSGVCCRTVNYISENIDLSPLLFMGRNQAIFEILLISNLLLEKTQQ